MVWARAPGCRDCPKQPHSRGWEFRAVVQVPCSYPWDCLSFLAAWWSIPRRNRPANKGETTKTFYDLDSEIAQHHSPLSVHETCPDPRGAKQAPSLDWEAEQGHAAKEHVGEEVLGNVMHHSLTSSLKNSHPSHRPQTH